MTLEEMERGLERITDVQVVQGELLSRLGQVVAQNTEAITDNTEAIARLTAAIARITEAIARITEAIARINEAISKLADGMIVMQAAMKGLFDHMDKFIRGLESDGHKNRGAQ